MNPIDVYIPDTSALVENPDCLERLLAPGNMVILLQQVLKELAHLQGSRHKSEGVKAAARAAVRKILELRNASVIHPDPTPVLTGMVPFSSLPTTPSGGVLAWEPPPAAVSENGNGDTVIVAAAERIASLPDGIEDSRVLVDELQNGDRHLAKTLMSRFCASSKVALAGCLDPVQIDNPYVDWRSNALTRIKETYKGFGPYVAQVRLSRNYRGPISTRADAL